MRELPALLILDFVALCICIKYLRWYAFAEKDEVFSMYRNKIDISVPHFERWILRKRIMWWSLTLLFAGLLVLMFSV